MKHIFFSDCHAQPHLIENVLSHANPDTSDHLVFAGDILDVGFKEHECLDILLDERFELLYGNHDLAVILGQRIFPQNCYNDDVRERIIKNQNRFKIIAVCDGVLVSHAGVSSSFITSNNIREVTTDNLLKMNYWHLREMWFDDSPLWYRPTKYNLPIDIEQVVGHTPPEWIERQGTFPKYHSVDPYTSVNFNETRFRYAVIENGRIEIRDSNDKKH